MLAPTVEVYGSGAGPGPATPVVPHQKEAPRPMRSIRTFVSAAFAVLIAAAGLVLSPGAAHADDIYRYWGYFGVQDGKLVAMSTGPAEATPADGSIEGYRYAAPSDFTNPNLPRADLSKVTFDAVCAATKSAAGQKRVAVLIDYGVEQDAPSGLTPPKPQALCAAVPVDANGLQVLQAVEPKLRTQTGSFGPLLCGIADYPATGCADEIAKSGTPADGAPVDFAIAGDNAGQKSAPADSSSNTSLLIGAGVLLAALVAGGAILARRRSA